MSTTKDSPVLYTEDTQTPTNVNTTAQAPITKSEDGVILEQYQDQNKQDQYATAPNTETSPTESATGSGLDAAKETEYSWNTKAEERAGLDYESQVLEAKSQYLTNRQELESQGQQMQEQVAMQKYSQNQSNEKAGWTGGYVLDTERQMAYLKQTIQSQMYGQMELQKYGYDTSLAAARLAYDTNKYDLALEYYNTALSRAVSEAEITGYYVSPETSEMLNEYSIASRTLNDPNAKEEDKQRADRVLASVYEWFEANGISKQGVETLTHQDFINTLKMTAQSMVNFQKDSDLLQIDNNSFGEVDADGNLIYSEGYNQVKTIHFDKMSNEDIIDYANRGELAKQQVMGYMDSIIQNRIESYLDTVKKEETKDGKTTTTYNVDAVKLKEYIINNTQGLQSLITNSSGILEDYTYNTQASKDKVYITIKDNKLAISFNKETSITSTTSDSNTENNTTTNNNSNITLQNKLEDLKNLQKPSAPDLNWNDFADWDMGVKGSTKIDNKKSEIETYVKDLGINHLVDVGKDLEDLKTKAKKADDGDVYAKKRYEELLAYYYDLAIKHYTEQYKNL